MPIQTRTEMLTTGFRSNLGLRVYGRSLHDIATAGEQIEQALKDFPETRSVFAERSEGRTLSRHRAGPRGDCPLQPER